MVPYVGVELPSLLSPNGTKCKENDWKDSAASEKAAWCPTLVFAPSNSNPEDGLPGASSHQLGERHSPRRASWRSLRILRSHGSRAGAADGSSSWGWRACISSDVLRPISNLTFITHIVGEQLVKRIFLLENSRWLTSHKLPLGALVYLQGVLCGWDGDLKERKQGVCFDN